MFLDCVGFSKESRIDNSLNKSVFSVGNINKIHAEEKKYAVLRLLLRKHNYNI